MYAVIIAPDVKPWWDKNTIGHFTMILTTVIKIAASSQNTVKNVALVKIRLSVKIILVCLNVLIQSIVVVWTTGRPLKHGLAGSWMLWGLGPYDSITLTIMLHETKQMIRNCAYFVFSTKPTHAVSNDSLRWLCLYLDFRFYDAT